MARKSTLSAHAGHRCTLVLHPCGQTTMHDCTLHWKCRGRMQGAALTLGNVGFNLEMLIERVFWKFMLTGTISYILKPWSSCSNVILGSSGQAITGRGREERDLIRNEEISPNLHSFSGTQLLEGPTSMLSIALVTADSSRRTRFTLTLELSHVKGT